MSDVSFAVETGRVTCLLGPSGCGKSTTLRILAGVERQDAGTVRVDGRAISDATVHRPPEARGIGLMFQDFALFPHLTVAGNVGYGLRREGRAARVAELLDRMGIARLARAYPHALSGGEQQRVALARALAPGPRVMLMDEPFSGLDERLRDQIREETLGILRAEGTAIVMVTHDPAEAMGHADEIVLMRDGRVVQAGSPYTLYTAPADLEVARFFSEVNVIETVARGALAATPFGPYLVPGHADGTPVRIGIRPQHLRVDFDRAAPPRATEAEGEAARAEVAHARFLGNRSSILFQLAGGQRMRATLPGVFLPPQGTTFYLTAPRRHCMIFAA
ncbi:MAG: ABC transporter ATP-binding protein [Shimia sp.]